MVNINDLIPDPNNANEHPEASILAIMAALEQYGQMIPLVVRPLQGQWTVHVVIAGNGRLAAAKRLGWTKLAVSVSDLSEVEATGFGLADNRTAEYSVRNPAIVARLAALCFTAGITTGYSEADIAAMRLQAEDDGVDHTAKLSEKFMVPPFSVLNAREGWWQDRKRAWIALGIKSELGRGETQENRDDKSLHSQKLGITFNSGSPGDLAAGFNRKAHPIPGGGTGHNSAYMFRTSDGYQSLRTLGEDQDIEAQSGTSIFDPVLCELAYRWFCPVGGNVFDPFAGGSVRGIVASRLGRPYTGIDLRQDQADANVKQAEAICKDIPPTWVVGDALDCRDLVGLDAALTSGYDFLFSCPPYADLEVYSNDPRDLSTMEYVKFLDSYRTIIYHATALLKSDRFACFVVGEVRDKKSGKYRGFVPDTIRAFQDAGLELYNEAILVTAVGSLPIRVGKQFSGYRKLGKTHQNVLVFVKGNPSKAVQACGLVEVTDLAEFMEHDVSAKELFPFGANAETILMNLEQKDSTLWD